jgi:hypothetical protein
MRRSVSVVFLFIAVVFQLSAQGAQLVFRDNQDIAWALSEYIMSGKVPVTNSFVYTGNEVARILDYSGRKSLTPGFKSRLLFSFNPTAVTGVTGIQTYGLSPTSDPTLLYFLDGLPLFLELGADMSLGDAMAAKVKIDLSMRQNYVGANDISLIAPWNLDAMLRYLMFWKFPNEGWVSAGSENAWIAAGRFKAGLGDGHLSNTLLNSKAEYYDHVQGALGNENFRFTSVIGTSATHLNKAEAAIQFRPRDTYDAGNNSNDPWDPINDHDLVTDIAAVKIFAYSQIEARFWDKFRFGIAQMNIIGGKTPGIIDILPTSFFHNAYSAGFTNVMMAVSAAAVPIKGLEIFGEVTVDDFLVGDEAGSGGKPAQFAWQAGSRYSFKPADDLLVTAGGEYTFANEWAYCRWQPYLTMYNRHIQGPSWATDWPLGFSYGPDAKHLGFYVNASRPKGQSVELGYEYLIKGPIYMGMMDADGDPIYYDYDVRTDNTKDTSLAAIRALPDQLSHCVSLKVKWPLPKGFEVNGSIQYWNHSNYRNVAGNSQQFFLYSGGVLWRY